jgi:hypothetical protein
MTDPKLRHFEASSSAMPELETSPKRMVFHPTDQANPNVDGEGRQISPQDRENLVNRIIDRIKRI